MDMQAEIAMIERGELDFDDSMLSEMLGELGVDVQWLD